CLVTLLSSHPQPTALYTLSLHDALPISPSHLERAVPRTCPVQVDQRLLKRGRRGLGQPRKVFLGLSHLTRLLYVTDERATASVFAPLLQADVPHNPAGVTDPLGEFLLLGGEGQRVAASGQHLTALLR